MDFAGNNFTYISKKKMQKFQEEKLKSNNLESIEEEQKEVESSEVISPNIEQKEKRMSRSSKCEKMESKSRSRSRSLESVNSQELDEVYSDEEECDKEVEYKKCSQETSKKSGGVLSSIKNFFMPCSSSKPSISKASNERSVKTISNPQNNVNNKVKYDLANLKKEKNRYLHEVDTNVVSFKFNFLKEKVKYSTGDPTYCTNCKAIFNQFSEIALENDAQIWNCEFCCTKNKVFIEEEEKPKAECLDFFIENVSKQGKDMNFNDENSIIYCFDTSGSMCVSEPVPGNFNIKGDTLKKHKNELMKFSDGSSQHYGNNQGGLTYISRLQCLQAGIENYVMQMAKASPKNKVGIVTFSSEVVCYGDGSSQDAVKLSGLNLNNFEKIVEIAEKSQLTISRPIGDSCNDIVKYLYSIEESGQTALGPSIVFAVHLIKNCAPGSKIILCTDGLANIGLGSMEGLNAKVKDDNYAILFNELHEFYSNLGNFAKSKGIIINILTFVGEESKFEILGQLCEMTGGEVIRVKPTEILNEFGNLMENEIVAMNVEISLKLPSFLEFRNEDNSLLTFNKTQVNKLIGNATNETELYVEYTAKSTEELLKLNLDISQMKKAYFQSVIKYTSMEGNTSIRVVTKCQEISNDKEKVQSQAKYEILSVNALQHCGKIAKVGDYRGGQSYAKAFKKMMKKNVSNSDAKENYINFNRNMCELNDDLQEIQYNEVLEKKEVNTENRNFARNDNNSKQIYGHMKMNAKKFKK